MTFEGEFEAYCYFTTFGYFEGRHQPPGRRRSAALPLKPGGRSVRLPTRLSDGRPPTRVVAGRRRQALEEVDFNHFNSRLPVQRQIILEDGQRWSREIFRSAPTKLHGSARSAPRRGFRVLKYPA